MAAAIFAVGAAFSAGTANAGAVFNVGDRTFGFTVKSIDELPEVKGRLVRMEYDKNGAELAWLDRDDDNKSFAIGFRTLPGDDTGVPHILEHSVLCGSAKYPVREPFVELLKSSFATFLNAWTSPDATSYPVSSRNQQDFLNLVEVYMDAVFNPLTLRSPLAFRQEGWHYELDGPDGELKRNGVVLSEMKGAFSDPERRLHHEISRMLFPDTTYGFVSGGDPAAIPSLTYEKYKAFYERFYHPSNARIFIDGKMDVAAVLERVGAYLASYDRREIDAPVQFQRPVSSSRTVRYAIGDGVKPEGKVYVAAGWVCGRFDEREKILALDVLADALASDNASPLKKALVEAGLCEDVSLGVSSYSQIAVKLIVKGVKEENVGAVRSVVGETLSRLADKGLDHARLQAILDRAEFHDLEKDYGSFPRGLAFYSDAIHLWNYGGDPADAFRNAAIFASLRRKMPDGWFEGLLRKCLIDNGHKVELTMLPSSTLAAELRDAEKKELAAIKAGWSREELEKVLAECRELEKYQSEPDRPEDVAKLPRLSVADIPEKCPSVEREISVAGGVTVIRPHTQANGVLHAECHFSAEDFTAAELADLPMLANVLADLRTARHTVEELQNVRDGRLGRFSAGCNVFAPPKSGGVRPYFTVKVSALESRAEDARDFVLEVLRETLFDDVKTIGRILRQNRLDRERSANGPRSFNLALFRAAAQVTPRGAVSETFNGISQIRHLQELDASFAEKGGEYAKRLSALAARLFTRDRLVVCLSDNMPLSWADGLAESLPRGEMGAPFPIRPFPAKKEGFRTLGSISSAAMLSHPAQNPYDGMAVVAARILSLDHLWEEIRVKGGAYGGIFKVVPHGDVSWASWNDPKPARSLGVYAGCAAALRAFADGDEPIDRYIVSAVANTEPYRTPSVETTEAAHLWLSGRTPADQQRVRSEMLKTTRKDIRVFADKLAAMSDSAAICVVGGAQPLETCTNVLEHVESVAK